jgi:hypothetical protein
VTRWHKAFATKGEAEGAQAYYRATGNQPPHLCTEPTKSFAAVASLFKARNKEWLDAHDGQTNSGRLAFAVTHLGALDVRAIRHAELLQFQDKVLSHAGRAGVAPSNRTVNYYMNAVSKVLRFAHKLDMIPGLPDVPRLANTGEARDVLTWAQEDAICTYLEAKGRAVEAFVVRVRRYRPTRGRASRPLSRANRDP